MSEISDFLTISENLELIREHEARLNELRALEISGFPLHINQNAAIGDLIQAYHKYMPLNNDLFSLTDRMNFCRNVREKLNADFTDSLLRQVDSCEIGTISYVQNSYSDEVYSRLCRNCNIKNRHIFHSFQEISDDFSNGSCDACILPVENTSDGKLMNFYSILNNFELKIVQTCDIDSTDNDRTTRYALLNKDFVLIRDMKHYLYEFSFNSSEHCGLNDILRVSDMFGLQLQSIYSLPLKYDFSACVYNPTITGTLNDITNMMLFLMLNLSQHTDIGVFNHIL